MNTNMPKVWVCASRWNHHVPPLPQAAAAINTRSFFQLPGNTKEALAQQIDQGGRPPGNPGPACCATPTAPSNTAGSSQPCWNQDRGHHQSQDKPLTGKTQTGQAAKEQNSKLAITAVTTTVLLMRQVRFSQSAAGIQAGSAGKSDVMLKMSSVGPLSEVLTATTRRAPAAPEESAAA